MHGIEIHETKGLNYLHASLYAGGPDDLQPPPQGVQEVTAEYNSYN